MASHSSVGPNDYTAISLEPYASAAGTEFKYIRYRSSNPIQPTVDNTPERQGGSNLGLVDIWRGATSIGGTMEAVARPDLTLYMLAAHLGRDLTGSYANGVSSGVVLHSMYPSSAPYVTVETNRANGTHRTMVHGLVISQLVLKMEATQPVSWEATVAGGYNMSARATALTPTYEAALPWQMGATTMTSIIPASAASISGQTTLQSATFTSKWDIDENCRTNRLLVEEVPILNYGLDIDASIRYENADLWKKCHYGDNTAQSLALASAFASAAFSVDHSYGAGGTTHRRLYLSVPAMYIIKAELDDMDPDGKTMYISLGAMAYSPDGQLSAHFNISGTNATSGQYVSGGV